MGRKKPDFSGWATKPGIQCADGRTIEHDAFAHQDQTKVPLVWSHQHRDPELILGHAILTKKDGGIRFAAFFNNNAKAVASKNAVAHEDVTMVSIWANELMERGKRVMHGSIKELSLVLAGANPEAKIDPVVIAHGDGDNQYFEELPDEVYVFTGETIQHGDDVDDVEEVDGQLVHAGERTYADVFDTLNDEQKELFEFAVEKAAGALEHEDDEGNALETNEVEKDKESDSAEEVKEAQSKEGAEDDEGDEGDEPGDAEKDTNDEGTDLAHQEGSSSMTKNLFEQSGATGATGGTGPTLSHDQLMTIVNEGKKNGSFKEALLAHADEYGIGNIELLFPDAKAVDSAPELIARRQEWVGVVLDGVSKLPFSRIKSLSADITHDEARAKGYVKATMKKEEFFALAKRETGPKTIYKKQKLDRDDIIDITELDVVTWLWGEMRLMLNEEIARAILVGDGRNIDDEDKIDEDKIRPIAYDAEFYTDRVFVPSNVTPQSLVEAVIRGRETYRGTGQPVAFMTTKVKNDMLLDRDRFGRRQYQTVAELEADLDVSKIVTVDVMTNATVEVDVDGVDVNHEILMVLVKLSDYKVGTTRGGQISTFEDFDIDWNQHKYLIEGRMSGALTKHKTAQVVLRVFGTLVDPDVPTFNEGTGVVTIPDQDGVVYKNDETDVTLASGAQNAIAQGSSLHVRAVPEDGYFFPHGTDSTHTFTRPAA